MSTTESGEGGRFSGRAIVACSAAAAVAAAAAMRRLTSGRDDERPPHSPDGSRAQIGVESQVKKVVRVTYIDASGVPQLARLDEQAFTEEVLRPGPGANAHAFLVYRFTAYTLRLLLNFNFRNIHFEKRQVVHRNSQEQEWEMIFKRIFRL